VGREGENPKIFPLVIHRKALDPPKAFNLAIKLFDEVSRNEGRSIN